MAAKALAFTSKNPLTCYSFTPTSGKTRVFQIRCSISVSPGGTAVGLEERPWKLSDARLVLEDGSVWKAKSFGASGTQVGEVVFNTSLTGVQFTEYIQKNVHLYQFRNGIPLTTAATANFTRSELATALRKNPYSVNLLLAGYDKETGPSLYYIDYIATLHKIEKGAFGYGSYFSLSMMDRHYHHGMSVEEAVDLADKCIMEIRSRLVVAPPNFVIKIVDKDGAREFAWRESIKDVSGAPPS